MNSRGTIYPDNMTDNKPRPGAALAMKALSYQKRQTFTNCCCIFLCPLLMVAIAAGLGGLINGLIAKAVPANGTLF